MTSSNDAEQLEFVGKSFYVHAIRGEAAKSSYRFLLGEVESYNPLTNVNLPFLNSLEKS